MNQKAFVLVIAAVSAISTLANAQPNPARAPITEAQTERIRAALAVKQANPALAQAVREAGPTIESFLTINSCLTGYNASALNVYAAPGSKAFPAHNYLGGPIPTMYRHSKTQCATVHRIHGWSMPAKNALRFEVVYVADDSGESNKFTNELIKQPSGEWLFMK